MSKGCYEKFDTVADELRGRLKGLRVQYLAARRSKSSDTKRRKESLEEHFSCAIIGAQTLVALYQLQELLMPSDEELKHLDAKVAHKMQELEQAAMRAARKAARAEAILA